MTHPFTTDSSQRNFDATPVADDAFMLDTLVFSARTFPVARRTKNAFAEKASLFRFESPIIDCLRIFDFAFAPRAHRVTRRHANRDLIKTHGPRFAHQLTPGMFVHVVVLIVYNLKIRRRSPEA